MTTMETEETPRPNGARSHVEPMPAVESLTPSLTFIGPPDAVAKLINAIAQARKAFGPIAKDREGQVGHQKFKYSPLATLTAASIEPLADAGVAVMQFLSAAPAQDRHRLTTVIAGHGARIETWVDFEPAKQIAEYGKHTTYLRRYMYNAIFVLDGEADADEGPGRKPPEEREIEQGQRNTIGGMLSKLGVPPGERDAYVTRAAGGKDNLKLNYMDAQQVIKALGAELDARKKGGAK